MAHHLSATGQQPETRRRYPCPEEDCGQDFKRRSDMERHRKSIHGRAPALGNRYIYRCRVPGCSEERNRKDHFQKHARREHLDLNVQELVGDAAVLVSDSVPFNRRRHARSHRRHRSSNTTQSTTTSVDDVEAASNQNAQQSRCHGEESLADSAIVLPGPSYGERKQRRRPTARKLNNPSITDCRSSGTSSMDGRTLVSRAILDLLFLLLAKRFYGSHPSPTHTAGGVNSSAEYDDCDIPVDGDQYRYSGSSGDFRGHPPGQGGGPNGGNQSWKGKEPMRDEGHGRDGMPEFEPSGTSAGPPSQLPCLWCLFHGPEHDQTPTCSTRKQYISLLWPHSSTKHSFHRCSICFRSFQSLELLMRHRKPKSCEALCLNPKCQNYDGYSSFERPCRHPSYNSPVVRWQMLYRYAHNLTRDDWVPDPTLESQEIPPRPRLPRHHPMYPFSLPANCPGLPGSQDADLLTQVGLGTHARGYPSTPVHNAPQPSSSRTRTPEDLLRHVLTTMWGCVNRTQPSWNDLAETLFQNCVSPDSPERARQTPEQLIDYKTVLEVLATEYALIIDNPHERTDDRWGLLRQLTAEVIRDFVTVPDYCPWERPAQPSPSGYQQQQPTPLVDSALYHLQNYQQPQSTFPIDPALYQPYQPGTTAMPNFPSAADRAGNTVPQAALDATTQLWVAMEDQIPANYHLQPPTDHHRRNSLTTLRSESEGPLSSGTEEEDPFQEFIRDPNDR